MDDLTLIARSKRRPIDDDTRSESGALEAADDDAYTRKCKLSYILIFPYPCNTYFNRPLILKKIRGCLRFRITLRLYYQPKE